MNLWLDFQLTLWRAWLDALAPPEETEPEVLAGEGRRDLERRWSEELSLTLTADELSERVIRERRGRGS